MSKCSRVSVTTTIYNRCDMLRVLYNSLNSQTIKNFRWIVVDDGSTDDIADVVKEIESQKPEFDFVYIRKENGGKHTALNQAFGMLSNDELVINVDSDDYLVEDAIETILLDWNKYGSEKVCGLCYKKMDKKGKSVCDDFGKDVQITNYNDFIINGGIGGDKAEVFRADILKKQRFPEYDGENFLGEGVMWSKISHDYNMVFINKAIYVCEYLEDGLTKGGRGIRIKNPRGGMYHAEEYLDKRYKLPVRMKNALLYLTYTRFAKISMIDIYKKNDYKVLLFINSLPSLLLYKYWGKKYGEKND